MDCRDECIARKPDTFGRQSMHENGMQPVGSVWRTNNAQDNILKSLFIATAEKRKCFLKIQSVVGGETYRKDTMHFTENLTVKKKCLHKKTV